MVKDKGASQKGETGVQAPVQSRPQPAPQAAPQQQAQPGAYDYYAYQQAYSQYYAQYAQYSAQAAARYHFEPKDWVVASWGLSKWYGMVLGLNNVTLGIKKGITGLLGPNGAGKSTFMKLITGQIVPSQGRLWVLGEEIRNNTHLKAIIGFCPEQDAFYSWMTGLEFVKFMARLQGMGMSEAEDAAKTAIKKVDLVKNMNRAIGGYSKGMRQRIKLATVVVHDPMVVILDEPLSGTDPLARVRIMDVVRDLEKDGKDVLISSHVLHEVERLTENIVLINKGRLLAQGNIHEIRDLIDKYPHTISIETAEPRRLGAELEGLEFVASMEFRPDMLVVKTPRPELFYKELPKVIARTGIKYSGLTSPDDNLNAVFKYLTEG